MARVGRRQFLVTMGALFAVPLAADVQQAKKVYRVGYIITTTPVARVRSDPTHPWISFVQELRNRGYVDGGNLILELRSLEGRLERAAEVASEMVRLQVDVIIATQNSVVRDVKSVTTVVPIVMLGTGGPEEHGLVATLARPGGNVTGLSLDPGPEIYRKQLELLKEAFPGISRVAFLGSRTDWEREQGSATRMAAQQLGLTLLLANYEVNDYTGAFSVIAKQRVDAIFVASNSHNYVHRRVIADFAAETRLPAIHPFRESAEAGGLMAYGVDVRDLFRRAAIYVDKILAGAKPGDLPVERPTQFELILNMKTARAVGFKLPQSVLLRADRVID